MTGAEDEPARLDLRLLAPALLGWAAVVALLPHRVPVAVGAALVAWAGAALLMRSTGSRSKGRHRAPPRWPQGLRGIAALSLVVVGLTSTATAAHLAHDRAGPVRDWAAQGALAQVVAVVTTEPRVVQQGDEREALVVMELRVIQAAARGSSSTLAAPVLLMGKAGQGWEDLRWRSTLRAEGRLQAAEPGGRAVAVLRPRGSPTTTKGPGPVLTATDHVRDRFRQAVQPLPADARGLVPGLVIGDTSLTPADLTDAMRATGMTHLSAVSGSNVALVVGAVAVVVARLGVPRRWRTPLTLLALVGFVLLCRPEPSVLRAGLMGTVGLLALSSSRRRVSLPALGAAVLVLLCLDPWLARSFGFALSTLATLGLVLWSRPWGDAIAARLPRRISLLGDAVAVPLAAQVACAPVIVLLQGSITTVAVLANLLAAPLVAPTTVLGVLAAVASPLSLTMAKAIAWLAAVPGWLIGWIARRCAVLPWGTVDWVDGVAGAWLLALLTVAALVTGPWWRDQLRRRPWWGWSALAGLVAWIWPSPALGGWPPPGWVVVGCDVGQGDAFVVRTGERSAFLYDAGPDPSAVSRCLRDLDLDHLDAVVLSHFHDDHVGGLEGALRALPSSTAYLSPVREPPLMAELTDHRLDAQGLSRRELWSGEVLAIGEAAVTVIGPGERPVAGESPANNGSLVLAVRTRGMSILLTGDLEPEGARPLRPLLAGQDFDVLKVAHHGSSAQDEILVAGTRAEVAMISVGADNTFGHPSPSALTLLADTGMAVLRTDHSGDIAVAREGEHLLLHRRATGGP